MTLVVWPLAQLAVAQERDAAAWQVVDCERGITVSRREQPGWGLPAYRGEGHVHGSVLQVLSVMLDIRMLSRWAFGVDLARVIKRIDARTDVIYLYSDLPWPVRDRDMILRKEVQVLEPGAAFRINLSCDARAEPERKGVVRVATCSSSFVVRRVDADTTAIDYVMSLDPGGLLPHWAGNYVAEHVPFNTLVALEAQAAEKDGQYEASIRRWSAAM